MPKGIRGFQKGNKCSPGRPKSSQNLLPIIRERVLKALNKRITIDRMLDKIDDVELLKFGMSLMPKDMSVKISTTPITYISNTPRPYAISNTISESPRLEDKTLGQEETIIDTESNALENNTDISNVSNESNANDIVSIDTDTDNDKTSLGQCNES